MELQSVQFQGGAAVERRGVCSVCHRALKNPKYVALGMWPICAGKQAAKMAAHGVTNVQRIPPLVSHWHVVKSDSERRNVLTAAIVREIRQKFKFHSPRRTNAYELSDEYGIAPATIYLAATGRTWSHIK